MIIREIIYKAALENKEQIKQFFYKDASVNKLAESNLDNYTDKNINDWYYVSIIEISLATLIFNYTIVVYYIEEFNNP